MKQHTTHFNDCGCLKAQLAEAQASNRQLVEALRFYETPVKTEYGCRGLAIDADGIVIELDGYGSDSEPLGTIAKQALSAPTAQRAQAEARVLALLPEFLECESCPDYGEAFNGFMVDKFLPAVEALRALEGV